MVEKRKRDFIGMNKFYLIIASVILVLTSSNCKDNTNQDGDCFIPPNSVNLVINKDLPQYFQLKNLGSYQYFEGGNKGVLVIHDFDDNYYAHERSCPYESFKECSVIEVDPNTLRLRCGQINDSTFNVCCNSEFTFSGMLLQGPSRCNLRPYRVSFSGNTIFVNN